MKIPNEYLKEKITQYLHMHYYTHLEEEKKSVFLRQKRRELNQKSEYV